MKFDAYFNCHALLALSLGTNKGYGAFNGDKFICSRLYKIVKSGDKIYMGQCSSTNKLFWIPPSYGAPDDKY